MVLKYNIEIQDEAIKDNVDRIINQIFKLLPNREEGCDWESPLKNLIVEIGGMNRLLNNQVNLFRLLNKMEALLTLKEEEDFPQFRKTIFECLDLMCEVKKCLV